MKEKLQNKIEAIVNFIIQKPESEITAEDYGILASELREIRMREQQVDNGKRWAELMSMVTSTGFSSGGYKS